MENTAKSTNEESGYGQPKKKKRKERQVALKQSQTNVLGINHDKSAEDTSKSLNMKNDFNKDVLMEPTPSDCMEADPRNHDDKGMDGRIPEDALVRYHTI